jgi:hypothetical protein
MWIDKNLKCISTNFEWPIFANMNILNMRTMISVTEMRQKINENFVLLKVASEKKFGQHFP